MDSDCRRAPLRSQLELQDSAAAADVVVGQALVVLAAYTVAAVHLAAADNTSPDTADEDSYGTVDTAENKWAVAGALVDQVGGEVGRQATVA